MSVWQVQTAKAKFSELLRAAREGPQTISVRGKEEFVLVTREAFEQATAPKRQMTWDELFAPIEGLGEELVLPPRTVDPPKNLFDDD